MTGNPGNTLPPDFLDGLRHAADEDDGWGHTLQARYMRQAADEIERLSFQNSELKRALDNCTQSLRGSYEAR